ncbi:MAG: hypothetical protein MJZ25_11335 [Fibrobacter sp.]|nr:hypothetical protein [Fibrobacter sp.]
MKLIAKIAAVVICLCVAAFILLRGFQEPVSEPSSAKRSLNLFETADSADFMIVYAVGLGEVKRMRTIDGRLYRNFVQLLRTNRMQENLQDTFATECKTGVRIDFYKDSTLIEEFRFADRIGRENVPGVWIPRKLAKINKFLKDNGAQFVACKSVVENNGVDVLDQALAEGKRPVLTMPKFGANRKSRKNAERDSSRDSVARVAVGLSRLDSSVEGTTQAALSLLDEMITPRDTAVGVPLKVLIEKVDGAEIYASLDSLGNSLDVVTLTKDQLDELKSILGCERLETFESGGRVILPQKLKIVLQAGGETVLELLSPSLKFNYFAKKTRDEKGNLDFEGVWLPQNPETLKSLFFYICAGITR